MPYGYKENTQNNSQMTKDTPFYVTDALLCNRSLIQRNDSFWKKYEV